MVSEMVPKISVCMPLCNGEKYVAFAIESILGQTETDWELVIADDLSDDDSLSLVETYASQEPRIRLQKNQFRLGHSGNYSRVIELARGKYIKLFAQDDFLCPTALEEMAAVLDENESVGVVSCARRVVSPEGLEIENIRPFPSSRLIKGIDAITYNLLALTNWIGEPSTGMCRRDLVQQGFDLSLYHYADCDFWFQVLEKSDYYYLDSVLCNYRRHDKAVTRKTLTSLAFACDVIRLGKKYRKYFEEFGDTEELFNGRAVEIISQHIDHLKRNNNLTLAQVLATSVIPEGADTTVAEQAAYINDLKELLFIYSDYVTRHLAENHAFQSRTKIEIKTLKKQKEALLHSTSWKVTSPLRHVVEKARGGSAAATLPVVQDEEPSYGKKHEIVITGGVKLIVGDHMSPYMKEVLRSGDYEKEELRIVSARLKSTDRVLELGTGIGLLSAYCAGRLGSERVFTFEANPELERPIREIYSINNVAPQLSKCILGEKEGSQEFYIMPDFWASSQSNLSKEARRVDVPVKSFNKKLQESRASFLIVDIEGGEYDLLKIADLSLVKRIAIEIHHKILGPEKTQEILELLKSLGFVLDKDISTSQEFFFARD